jgi:hypothetical protein
MNIFSYFSKLFASESTAQDAHLPLKINFNSTVTFEINPILSAMTHGAMIDVLLDNLKVLSVKSISSIKIEGMDNKKIYRFYFNKEGDRKRLFLQVMSDSNNVDNIDEILFCSSVTEPPVGEEDILFFLGDNESGLGEASYSFSREDLYTFLSRAEVDKRLGDADGVEYTRVEPEQDFMPAFSGEETVIFDAYGTTGESRRVMNLMPHSRALTDTLFEELLVAFWVTTSKNGNEITIEDQLPLAEYIFAIKLERINIKVI